MDNDKLSEMLVNIKKSDCGLSKCDLQLVLNTICFFKQQFHNNNSRPIIDVFSLKNADGWCAVKLVLSSAMYFDAFVSNGKYTRIM